MKFDYIYGQSYQPKKIDINKTNTTSFEDFSKKVIEFLKPFGFSAINVHQTSDDYYFKITNNNEGNQIFKVLCAVYGQLPKPYTYMKFKDKHDTNTKIIAAVNYPETAPYTNIINISSGLSADEVTPCFEANQAFLSTRDGQEVPYLKNYFTLDNSELNHNTTNSVDSIQEWTDFATGKIAIQYKVPNFNINNKNIIGTCYKDATNPECLDYQFDPAFNTESVSATAPDEFNNRPLPYLIFSTYNRGYSEGLKNELKIQKTDTTLNVTFGNVNCFYELYPGDKVCLYWRNPSDLVENSNMNHLILKETSAWVGVTKPYQYRKLTYEFEKEFTDTSYWYNFNINNKVQCYEIVNTPLSFTNSTIKIGEKNPTTYHQCSDPLNESGLPLITRPENPLYYEIVKTHDKTMQYLINSFDISYAPNADHTSPLSQSVKGSLITTGSPNKKYGIGTTFPNYNALLLNFNTEYISNNREDPISEWTQPPKMKLTWNIDSDPLTIYHSFTVGLYPSIGLINTIPTNKSSADTDCDGYNLGNRQLLSQIINQTHFTIESQDIKRSHNHTIDKKPLWVNHFLEFNRGYIMSFENLLINRDPTVLQDDNNKPFKSIDSNKDSSGDEPALAIVIWSSVLKSRDSVNIAPRISYNYINEVLTIQNTNTYDIGLWIDIIGYDRNDWTGDQEVASETLFSSSDIKTNECLKETISSAYIERFLIDHHADYATYRITFCPTNRTTELTSIEEIL